MKNSTLLRAVVGASLLFWAPALASAQSDDTSTGLGTSGEVDVNADAEMEGTGSASGSSSTSLAGGDTTVQLDPGPNRPTGTVQGAQDAGTLGVGADGLLSGLVGLQMRYQATDTIGLQLALRFNVAALQNTAVGFGTGLSGIFTVFEFEGGHLALVGSIDFQIQNQTFGPMTPDATRWDLGIGGGIFAEIFPTEFFSIHGQAGARIAFGDDNGANTFSIGIGGDVFAGFGFTFWFV